MTKPRVRFAPSPTGHLHVGNIRTALVNYLYAKSCGGAFMLRIDDTDDVRSTKDYEDSIRRDLVWMGMEWDSEARQSDRLEYYRDGLQRLIESGRAYPCFETPEELSLKRKSQLASGKPPVYDRAALSLSGDEIKARTGTGEVPHYRFKLDHGDVIWDDLVRGEQSIKMSSLSDPVICRADGRFIYTLASVIDDGDYKITHIMRGEDHTTNSAAQIQLFQALGYDVPQMGHFALLAGAGGEGLSKRLGSLSVGALRGEGVEAMALTSMLARIGTADPVVVRKQMIEALAGFDITRFGRATPRFEMKTLWQVNAKLVSELDYDDVKDRLGDLDGEASQLEALWEVVKGNLSRVDEVRKWWNICFLRVAQPNSKLTTPDLEEISMWHKSLLVAGMQFPEGEVTTSTWREWTESVIESTQANRKKVFTGLRFALTGEESGPDMSALLPLMGRERILFHVKEKVDEYSKDHFQRFSLHFHNSLTRLNEAFTPLEEGKVQIYVCGPTVYDRIHVGNARPVVVFDVLVRLLRYEYPHVTYVRNITDIDDKINMRAAEMGITIRELANETIKHFHEDCAALCALPPDHEPRATDHIPQMIDMISTLIAEGKAYEAEGHVLFQTDTMPEYGKLSGHDTDALLAGARVEVAPYKRSPMDFILWKPSDADQPAWESPWGRGRPGWHIECSAMSAEYLGEKFDIHGGGLDLLFPHHENEIAQSCSAHHTDMMAQFWLHNGYVTVNGEKMSKSTGNFITVADALKAARGEVVRYTLLGAHYRAPLDFSMDMLTQSATTLDGLYRVVGDTAVSMIALHRDFRATLTKDLNTPGALAWLHRFAEEAKAGDERARQDLKNAGAILGLLNQTATEWFQQSDDPDCIKESDINQMIAQRNAARKQGDFAQSDQIRDRLAEQDIILEDNADGTIWRRR